MRKLGAVQFFHSMPSGRIDSKGPKKTKMQVALTIERLRTSGAWPKLKANAAATRHLARYALQLVQADCDGSEHDKYVLAVITLLVRFYDILESSSMFLSSVVRIELPKLGRRLT